MNAQQEAVDLLLEIYDYCDKDGLWLDEGDWCVFCECYRWWTPVKHDDDCPFLKLKSFVEKNRPEKLHG